MTNLEWLFENRKDFIEDCLKSDLAITKDLKIKGCLVLRCEECLFEAADSCRRKRSEWLDKEYVEPEIEIDWENVPIDTPILVSVGNGNWHNRYFAGLVDNYMVAWDRGTTSWSANGETSYWKYAKLARLEDIEKYRKR